MSDRLEKYRKDAAFETFLDKFNSDLEGIEEGLSKETYGPGHPIVFVIGTPRSGTTLLSQVLINRYGLAYPSNLMSRFWNVARCGAYMHRNLFPEVSRLSLSSDIGYTTGADAPHEFGYFWRKWLVDKAGKEAELGLLLGHMTSIFGRAMLYKNLHYVPFQLQALLNVYEDTNFVVIERDLCQTAVSVYKARLRLYGSVEKWFGPEMNDMNAMADFPPESQIICQLEEIQERIEKQASAVPSQNVTRVRYEDLLSDPNGLFSSLESKYHWLEAADYNPQFHQSRDEKTIEDIVIENRFAKLIAER